MRHRTHVDIGSDVVFTAVRENSRRSISVIRRHAVQRTRRSLVDPKRIQKLGLYFVILLPSDLYLWTVIGQIRTAARRSLKCFSHSTNPFLRDYILFARHHVSGEPLAGHEGQICYMGDCGQQRGSSVTQAGAEHAFYMPIALAWILLDASLGIWLRWSSYE